MSQTSSQISSQTSKSQTAIPEALNNYPSVYTQTVIWNDMDALNHVNNVVYYRYAESARINYLAELGYFGAGENIVLAQSSCQYLLPVTYPDTLLIGVRTTKIGNTSLVMEYCYYSTAQDKVVANGETVLVRLNKEGTGKMAWSEQERQQVLDFEKAVGNTPQS